MVHLVFARCRPSTCVQTQAAVLAVVVVREGRPPQPQDPMHSANRAHSADRHRLEYTGYLVVEEAVGSAWLVRGRLTAHHRLLTVASVAALRTPPPPQLLLRPLQALTQ